MEQDIIQNRDMVVGREKRGHLENNDNIYKQEYNNRLSSYTTCIKDITRKKVTDNKDTRYSG